MCMLLYLWQSRTHSWHTSAPVVGRKCFGSSCCCFRTLAVQESWCSSVLDPYVVKFRVFYLFSTLLVFAGCDCSYDVSSSSTSFLLWCNFIVRLYYTLGLNRNAVFTAADAVAHSTWSIHFVSILIQTRRFLISHNFTFWYFAVNSLLLLLFFCSPSKANHWTHWIVIEFEVHYLCGLRQNKKNAHNSARGKREWEKERKKFVSLVDYLIHIWSSNSMCHLFYAFSIYLYYIAFNRFSLLFFRMLVSCQVHVCIYSMVTISGNW